LLRGEPLGYEGTQTDGTVHEVGLREARLLVQLLETGETILESDNVSDAAREAICERPRV